MCPGYEADDVIGTLVAREVAKEDPAPVEVITGDRDLFQLVDDTVPVRVLYTIRGIRDLMAIDQAVLKEKYGVPSGPAYADMAVLRGDPSDGLPGVPGIGEKTAAQLIHRYGSLVGILAARDAGDPGLTATQKKRLVESAAYLTVAPAVVRVAPDAPVRGRRRPVAARRRGRRRARRAGGEVGSVVEREARGGRPRAGLTRSLGRVNCAERVEVGRIRHGRLSSCCDVVTDR